jgi:UDP-N-acetylmuramyl pentapeptide phosphotransferase/UDP-N-acetylglucosamine-1-phosphate transferase
MHGYAGVHEDDDEDLPHHRINLPWVIGAAILCGIGLTLTFLWLIDFQWKWFPGVAISVVGFLLFFDRRAGIDRAE